LHRQRGFAKSRENWGASARIGELCEVRIRRTECEAAGGDFMDDVFAEGVARDEREQFRFPERGVFWLRMCQGSEKNGGDKNGHTTAGEEKHWSS
jgi:hypothetical protein